MEKNTSGEEKTQVVLMVAKNFLKYHGRAGEPTFFEEKIRNGEKLHTIRADFYEWEKKIQKVQSGQSVLCVKQWSGVPYRTPQIKLFMMDDVGVQKLEYIDEKFIIDGKTEVSIETLAKNDGLSVEDFKEWFKVFPVTPMCVIHFTKFRY